MLPTVNEANFGAQVLHTDIAVLVKFSAPWCQPCKAMDATLIELIPELGNHVRFVNVDIETSPKLADMFAVRGLPTIMLFKKGQPIGSMNGNFQKARVRSWILDQLAL